MDLALERWLARRWWWVCAALVLAAAAIRIPALATDFWLDEVWSWEFASQAGSAWEIFAGAEFKHDNNHPLNTWFLYLMGDRSGWIAYRLPALIGGVGAVIAALMIGLRRSRLTALLYGLLMTASFFMCVYSTEARGYGPAIFFSLAGLLALRRYFEGPSTLRAAAFWACTILGFLSHFSFAHFYLGAGLWSVARGLSLDGTARQRALNLLRLHAVPVAYVATLYAVVLRHLRIGGGPPWVWPQVIDESLAWTLGYPVDTVPATTASLVVLVVGLWELRNLWRERSDEWLLYAGVILIAPALILALRPPEVLFPRYFAIPLAFLSLLLVSALARVCTRSPRALWLAAVAVVAFLVGNAAHLVPFIDHGRGQYRKAIEMIVSESGSEPIVIGSDHDLRNGKVIRFYARIQPGGRKIDYRRLDDWPAAGPDWLIRHTQDYIAREPALPQSLAEVYVLEKVYPSYGPSGMNWFLYRRGR
jgi:hypothetical protein